MRIPTCALIALLVALSAATTAAVSAAERPTEAVSPAPLGNPNAVVWRTPEPPANPQKCDLWVNPKDGVEMVYIAPGEFILGSSNRDLDTFLGAYPREQYVWFTSEQPQCRLQLGGYWIGRTEVTNAQYLRFVEATGCPKPDHWHGGRIPEGLENFPVVFVEWEDARAYCEWAGGRLPSEPEWEKAARGGDGRVFPWGNQWDANRCRSLETVIGRGLSLSPSENVALLANWRASHDEIREGPVAVGSYPNGASPFGCLDAAGNVWEWCADWYAPGAYQRYSAGDLTPPQASPVGVRVTRGGSFGDGHPRAFRCAYRHRMERVGRDFNIGFRCARDARPPDASPSP